MTEARDPGHRCCGATHPRARRCSCALRPLVLASSACVVPLGKLGDEDTDGTSDDGTSGMVDPSDGGSTGETDGPVMPLPTEREVDVLFVIDNSGSMAEEQAKLATSIEALVTALDAVVPPVDYRIAVTTTDNGNPWCGATNPEAGMLRASSCRSRPQEFTFDGATMIEAFEPACDAVCPQGKDELDIADGVPWIDVQRTLGTDNVGGAVVDNLRCMLPQGIDGCGFEQPLESLWKSVARFEDPQDVAFGFHRPGALLAVMIVSDEVDCSYNSEWDSIFLPEGDRAFWSDRSAASPTSAVCWNAGVACTENEAGGLDCVAADFDVLGNPAATPEEAVLYPVGRYTTGLVGASAFVSGIYGVDVDGSVAYQVSFDPQFQRDFGIGAGCESASGTAVPPGRTIDVVTALGGGHYSICAAGFESSLTTFAQDIIDRLP